MEPTGIILTRKAHSPVRGALKQARARCEQTLGKRSEEPCSGMSFSHTTSIPIRQPINPVKFFRAIDF